MLHSHPTLVSKPLMPHLAILYLLPPPPHHRPLLLAVLLRLLPPLPLTLSGFFNGMLVVYEPGALNYSTFFRPILSTLSAFRESNLNSSFSFRIPRFSALRSDGTHSRSGIHSRDTTHPSCASSFSSGRAYLSLNFPHPFFLRLIPTLIM